MCNALEELRQEGVKKVDRKVDRKAVRKADGKVSLKAFVRL